MKEVNLLDFLNTSNKLFALDYANCGDDLVNFLSILEEDENFTKKIDLGVFFIFQKVNEHYVIVDGLNRLLSLSLLLHAICECYKKTSEKNEKAITTIRKKYLLAASSTKLRLPEKMQTIYEKIIMGERLSGKEKNSPLFVLLHNFWTQIKENKLQASSIFKMLNKVKIILIEVDGVPLRDVYYSLNKNNRTLDHDLLIIDLLKEYKVEAYWDELKAIFNINKQDLYHFFEDFFITKFNFKSFDKNRLYDIFKNYFDTMLEYTKPKDLFEKLKHSARLYRDILNINFNDVDIKNLMINIKIHNGEDTYAYLLDIYGDYVENRISKATFCEILSTIDEYLVNRQKNPSNMNFNELIRYLEAFITCK